MKLRLVLEFEVTKAEYIFILKPLESDIGKKYLTIVFLSIVNKNGELIERVQQNVNTKQNSESEKPKTHVIGEIEIPSKGVHKVYEGDVQREMIKKKYDFRRQSANNKLNDNLVRHSSRFTDVRIKFIKINCSSCAGINVIILKLAC